MELRCKRCDYVLKIKHKLGGKLQTVTLSVYFHFVLFVFLFVCYCLILRQSLTIWLCWPWNYHLVQSGLEFVGILLPHHPGCWHDRCGLAGTDCIKCGFTIDNCASFQKQRNKFSSRILAETRFRFQIKDREFSVYTVVLFYVSLLSRTLE